MEAKGFEATSRIRVGVASIRRFTTGGRYGGCLQLGAEPFEEALDSLLLRRRGSTAVDS
jgi:hypothetical protein